MQHKNSAKGIGFGSSLLFLLPLIKKGANMIFLETLLAGRNLKKLLVLFFIKLLFMLTAWFSLMAALVLYLPSFGMHLIESFLVVAVFNIFLAGIIWLCLKRKRRFTFGNTRKKIGSALDTKHIKQTIEDLARKNPLITIAIATTVGTGLAFLLKPKKERSQP